VPGKRSHAGAEGGKPQVVKCGALSETQFGAGALAKLARKIAVPHFQWTLPLARGDYKVVVVPEPSVKPAEMADSVRWSMGALLDYPVEEAVVDWMSIPTQEFSTNAHSSSMRWLRAAT
jgi:hypothetical protein